jgi:hypothetical protein
MYWLIDNAHLWYILFGIVALGFAAGWWLNRKPKYLLGVAVAIALIGLVWLLALLIVTDRKQLELNVHAMAEAVVQGKKEVLLKFLTDDFSFKGQTRGEAIDEAIREVKAFKVSEIAILQFDVEEWKEQSAKVYVRARVRHGAGDAPVPVVFRGVFVKDKGQWKLKSASYSTAPW